jgi:MSHA biogenesis protein MshO
MGATNVQTIRFDKNHCSAGFTLIEIVVTIVLLSIIGGIAAMIIMQGARGYSAGSQLDNLHYQARLAMERMEREMRLIRNQGSDITMMMATNLQFIDVNSAPTGFSWTAPMLSRWNGTGYDTLATGITALSFTYLQQDGVTAATAANVWFINISMTSQQGSDMLVMQSRVHPRNF